MSNLSSQNPISSRSQIEAHLQKRAAEDPAFRQALLSDPRSALKQETGINLPSKFEVNVVEESSDHLYLVLPAEHGELSDFELEAMAGGAIHGGGQPSVYDIGSGGNVSSPSTSAGPSPASADPAPAKSGK